MMFSTFTAAAVVVVVVVAVVTGLIVLFWCTVSWLNSFARVWKLIQVPVQFLSVKLLVTNVKPSFFSYSP